MLLVFEDITDRKQRERDALSLTNEISHRIKNNLQVIVGLIAYEAKWTATPCVQGYKTMQARIGAIAQLYDLISQTSRGQTVAVDAYLREIAKTMSASLLGNMSGIEIEVKAEPLEIDPNRAVPFGLLVNELTTNAIKHAFPQMCIRDRHPPRSRNLPPTSRASSATRCRDGRSNIRAWRRSPSR